MDPTLIIPILVIALVAILVIGGVLWQRRRKSRAVAEKEYIAGLHYLIDGDRRKALEKLRATVRLDTEFIDAYIKIGDILRDQGNAESAVKVHRDLLVRPNLTNEQRIAINKSLAQDYREAGQYVQAIEICEHILEIDRRNRWARDFELDIYERMGEWQSAYELVKKNSLLPKEEKNVRLACYRVEQGRQAAEKGNEKEARQRYREAIKLSSKCVQAFLELADSYSREHRPSDALSALKKLIEKNPSFSELAFTRLKHVLFELGHFGDIENVYRDLLKTNPKVVDAHLGLAEIYEKKGEIRKAVDICKKALELDPNRMDAQLMLIRLYSQLGRDEQASELAASLATQLLEDRNRFICSNCGYTSRDYFWHCPNCRAWNSAGKGE